MLWVETPEEAAEFVVDAMQKATVKREARTSSKTTRDSKAKEVQS